MVLNMVYYLIMEIKMTNVEILKEEIEKIKLRNARVEKDKKWETSWTRRTLIALGTYILVLLFMLITKTNKPFLASLIPSIAFLISTASLEFVKSWWLKKN